jgi:osmotically-inducible protein OsmY
VQVDVRNGVAILTGTVSDRDEMRAAIEHAYDGGAQKVVNHIEVGRYEDRQGENRGDTGLARAVASKTAVTSTGPVCASTATPAT